jgi:hypothetical protein
LLVIDLLGFEHRKLRCDLLRTPVTGFEPRLDFAEPRQVAGDVRIGNDRLKLGMIVSHLPRKRLLFVSQSLALDMVPLLNVDGCLP